MIEIVVLEYLTSRLSISVYMEEPETAQEKYIVVEKTGSSEDNHVQRATMAFQSYADSMVEAAELNESLKNALVGIIELDSVSKCKLNSDYNFTDTQKKKYRYQAIYDFVFF